MLLLRENRFDCRPPLLERLGLLGEEPSVEVVA